MFKITCTTVGTLAVNLVEERNDVVLIAAGGNVAGHNATGTVERGEQLQTVDVEAVPPLGYRHRVTALPLGDGGVGGATQLPIPGGVLVRNADRILLGAVGTTKDTSDADEECAVEGIKGVGLVADTSEFEDEP